MKQQVQPLFIMCYIFTEKWVDFKTVDDFDTPNSRFKYWHTSQNVITE